MFNHFNLIRQPSQALLGMIAQNSQVASDELKKKDKEERFQKMQKSDIQKRFEQITQTMNPANESFLS